MASRGWSCRQRIRQELASKNAAYGALWRQFDDLKPLDIEIRPVVTVQSSQGKPSDCLEIELADDNGQGIRRVVYHFADGCEEAARVVTETEAPAVWRTAEYFLQAMTLQRARLGET